MVQDDREASIMVAKILAMIVTASLVGYGMGVLLK
jgi:hypothetical protein